MNHPSEDGFWDDDEDDEIPDAGPVAKPDELLALHGVSAELFEILKGWFAIGDSVALDLGEIDSAVGELGDPQMVIALAMRKLQALHLLATPGVRTVTDVVVAIINDLERAMVQAPNMWLKRRAASIDWDDAFALLSDPTDTPTDAPEADDSPLVGSGAAAGESLGDESGDDMIDRFRYLHSMLHDAMFSVIEVSGGAIRELE